MKKEKEVRQRQLFRWGAPLLGFLIINAILRAALLPLNAAEYTDGVLQLIQFREPSGIWPPLYTAFTWPIAFLTGELWAGRVVSWAFSTAAVIPIFLIAHRCFGTRAAVFAALIYTVAPTSLRWAPRVMTEATFSFFFWFACDQIMAAQAAKDPKEAGRNLLWASIFGGLAALTRYQGLMLALPIMWIIGRRYSLDRAVLKAGLLGLLMFGFAPLWSLLVGNIHGEQFEQRAGDNPLMTIVLNAEPFMLYWPYWLTYPVALLVVAGINVGKPRPGHVMWPLTIYVMFTLLIAQSLFGSFQERYFLPLFGLFFVWAGVGLAALDHRMHRRAPRLRPWLPIGVVIWSLFVSTLVLGGSRDAFGDIARASKAAREAMKSTPAARLFTNEVYRFGLDGNPTIAANKVAFFAHRQASALLPNSILRKGDVIVLSSAYGDPMEAIAFLRSKHDLEMIGEEFRGSLMPVFADIMARPGTAQNPLAFVYRYEWQDFQTVVVRIVR